MTILIASILLVGIVFLLLGTRIFFVKGGQFPNTHIGGSKALKDQGVSCATTQDRLEQKSGRKNRLDFARMSGAVEDSLNS